MPDAIQIPADFRNPIVRGVIDQGFERADQAVQTPAGFGFDTPQCGVNALSHWLLSRLSSQIECRLGRASGVDVLCGGEAWRLQNHSSSPIGAIIPEQARDG